jgi:hypothetical protein
MLLSRTSERKNGKLFCVPSFQADSDSVVCTVHCVLHVMVDDRETVLVLRHCCKCCILRDSIACCSWREVHSVGFEYVSFVYPYMPTSHVETLWSVSAKWSPECSCHLAPVLSTEQKGLICLAFSRKKMDYWIGNSYWYSAIISLVFFSIYTANHADSCFACC